MFWSRIKMLFRMVKYYYFVNPSLLILKETFKIGGAVSSLARIFVLGLFIDGTVEVLTNWNVFSLEDYFLTDSFQYLLLGLILWCFTSIFTKMAEYFEVVLDGEFYFQADLEILDKISKTNLQEIEERRFQDLMTYVPEYSTTRFAEAYNLLSTALVHFTTLLGSIIMLSRFLGAWSLLLVVFVLPEATIRLIRSDKISEYADNSINKVKFMTYIKHISTRVQDFPELRVSGAFRHLKRLFYNKSRSYYSGYYEQNFHYYSDQTLFSVIDQILLTGFIIFILAKCVVQGATIGTFSALVNYARDGYKAAFDCISNVFDSLSDLSYVQGFFDLLYYEGFGDVPGEEYKLKKGCPNLEFKNLSFVYPKTRERGLINVDFKIQPGDKVAFVGTAGSGKSSIVRILCGLFKVNSGDYLIDGCPVKDLARGQLKSKISVMPQDFVRYNLSLRKNIVIGDPRKNVDKLKYEKVKEIALVDEFMKDLNISDSQLLGKFFGTGKELAPAHWQKLAIARMLYRDKEIMIMDEPFTFIDGISKSKIFEGIIDFVGDKKILIYITQDTAHLDRFDKIFYFEDGKVVEQGSWDSLMKKKGSFYRLVKYDS